MVKGGKNICKERATGSVMVGESRRLGWCVYAEVICTDRLNRWLPLRVFGTDKFGARDFLTKAKKMDRDTILELVNEAKM